MSKSFADIFEILMAEAGEPEPEQPEVVAPVDETELVQDWRAMHLTGLCRSGGDNSGKLIHAVWTYTEGVGCCYATAACGRRPSGKSNGWDDTETSIENITCPKCLAKLQKLGRL